MRLTLLGMILCASVGLCGVTISLRGQEAAHAKLRARDLGVPFDGTPGAFNAITDVAGVTVGHTTLISGDGKLVVGKGPVRTGVTAVMAPGKDSGNNFDF